MSRRYEDYAPRRYVDYGTVGYSTYDDSCGQRRVPVADGRGGWVWDVRSNCY